MDGQFQQVDVSSGKITVKAMFVVASFAPFDLECESSRGQTICWSSWETSWATRSARMEARCISTSPIVCIMCVRRHCRSCVFWRIRIQAMMLDFQQKLCVKLQHRGHDAFPTKLTDEERTTHLLSHLPCRAFCNHCVKGLARDWPHRSDYGPPPKRKHSKRLVRRCCQTTQRASLRWPR